MMGTLRRVPPLPHLPATLHGMPVVAAILTYAGPVERGEKTLQPLRKLGAAVIDTLAAKPYVAHQKMLDPMLAHGRGYYWKGDRLGRLNDKVIEIMTAHAGRITSPWSTVPFFAQGGAVARVPEDETAFPGRDAAYDMTIVAAWMPGDPEREAHIAWARDFHTALEPFSTGVYVNFINDESAHQVMSRAYRPGQWERLVALKAEYDPDNFFRLNANIPPPRH
jgi:hypothetical protein